MKLAENYALSAKIEIEIVKEPVPHPAGLFAFIGNVKD